MWIIGISNNAYTLTNELTMLFVTGNSGKFAEVSKHLNCVQVDLDLVEIQELDSRAVVAAKLAEARSKCPKGRILIEDTSLHFEAMGGFPGPLIKWLERSVSLKDIAAMVAHNPAATARTIFGLMTEDGTIAFYEGTVEGKIVSPKGSNGFGWDQIFQPDGSAITFAEMTLEEKEKRSSRAAALNKVVKGL